MGRITNKHIIKIKELISDEVCMGTFGLVELELLEMEKDFLDRIQNTSSNIDYARCKIEAEIKRLEENPEGDYVTRISALEWAHRLFAERYVQMHEGD